MVLALFIGVLYAGEAIFGNGFGGYSPGFLHAVLFASVVLTVLNTVAQLGLKVNMPTLWHYTISTFRPESTGFSNDFYNLQPWQRILFYYSVYFLYLILGVVIVALLV
jgi:hypothetical protein